MIKFEKIEFRNFLATGNTPNVVFLNRVPSILITGTNGSGKSTLLDAICFALFGKAYRNIKKDQLINSVNEKGLVVELDFTVNEVPYKIVRGMKPNKFQIFRNEVEIPHDAAIKDYQRKLESILGLNMRAFTQIVILGSARYQSFMDLTTMDRKIVIEEILDITVFSRMNEVLKTRMQQLELDIKENSYQKDIVDTKLSAQKGLILNLKNRTKESDEKVEAERKRVDAEIKLIDKKISELDSEITKIIRIDVDGIKEKIQKAKIKENAVNTQHKQITNSIDYYNTHDVCGECTQTIDEEFKTEKLSKLNNELGEVKKIQPLIETAFEKLNESLNEAKTVEQHYEERVNKRREFTNERSTLQTLLRNLTSTSTAESDEAAISSAETELVSFEVELKNFEKQALDYSELRHYYEACKILLKDSGIKAKIISQYLPVMNKLINKYLDQMGASYSFHLDEQFNEIIKSRYRDNFSYASFSEGEKSRIDLSLMFTWREIAKLKNSVNTNLLIMDEVSDGSLDGEATDSLWDILADLSDTNVFVISHKVANTERFTSHMQFTKEGNFSKIVDSKV